MRPSAPPRLLAALAASLLLAWPLAAVADDERRTAALAALADAAREQRYRLHDDGEKFSGPAWEKLVAAGRSAQFFLLGEEHGIAENPRLAGQLYAALVPSGYRRFVIEVSPPMAGMLDAHVRAAGVNGLRALFAQQGHEPAFFGMAEEAQLLETVVSATPGDGPVLWGVDYEVGGDRALIEALRASPPPETASVAFDALDHASRDAWQRYGDSGNPGMLFSFSGDPKLLRELRAAWSAAGDDAAGILLALEETLAINALWVAGDGWGSNARRADFIRQNFLRHWQAIDGERPRVMVKLGASHVVRGRTPSGTFDLGTLIPELAMQRGTRSVSLLVLPGRGSPTAVLDPTSWTYREAPAKDGYARGLEPLLDAVYEDGMTLIDLTALRDTVGSRVQTYGDNLLRTVHGFDWLLVMTGSTASAGLEDRVRREGG